jgi:hypothetical protein
MMVAVVGLAACADHEPPGFAYQATAIWSSSGTPTVVAVTIDGQPVAENTRYMFAATFSSFNDALDEFVAKPVVLTTTTGTLDFTLDIGACTYDALPAPLTSESDQFFVLAPVIGDSPPTFEIDSYTCTSGDMSIASTN